MSDLAPFDEPAPRFTGREILAVVFTLIGAIALVTGVALYDPRAGICVAGAIALIVGVLLGLG